MEFRVKKVLGASAHTKNAVAITALPDGQPASVESVGAGAVLTPLNETDASAAGYERFYYRAPKPGSAPEPIASSSSPQGSPESASTSPGGHKLVRVNKAGCVAASSRLVAVGEAGGYLPRLLLYDLLSGECLSVLRDQHQFGVLHLRFSPSGRYLASLGTPQDGFLYIWLVSSGQLELQASNKCISEVRDIAWLNDDQLITCGVRHIKLWTVGAESILPGRNILLKETLDQTFECACPSNSAAAGAELIVGTARGELYRMPAVQLLARLQTAQAVQSIVAMDAPYLHVFVSTQSNIYEFRHSFDVPYKSFAYPAITLLPFKDDVYYLSDNAAQGRRILRLASLEVVPFSSHKAIERTPRDYKGMQLSSNEAGDTLLWRNDEPCVYRWPLSRIDMPITDITVAYALTSSEQRPEAGLMVGSLCGDLWLAGELFNAHNGPITDAHQSGRIAVTSGRDRSVQLWLRSDNDDTSASPQAYKLAQTLMFTSPILKAKLCVRSDGAYALLCCAANKIAYCYSTDGIDFGASGPIFPNPPKSVLLKGMPFDVAALESMIIVSTNDKHVSVLDMFAEDKLKYRWRAYNTNAESINLTHMQIIVHEDARYIIAAGSDKCVHLFTYPKGELVATQWGHGEPISGVAWTGAEALSAGDSLLVSSLRVNDRPRVGRPRSLTYVEPPSPSLPRFVLPGGSQTASTREEASSPPRRIYNASHPPRPRSVSPQRMVPSRSLARSPSPTRDRVPASVKNAETGPGHTVSAGSAAKERDSDKPALAYKPLRLATPISQARSVAAAAASPERQDPTANLVAALQQFIDQPLSQHDTEKLKPLLVSALNKVNGFALVEEFSGRLCESVEARIDRHLAERLKRL